MDRQVRLYCDANPGEGATPAQQVRYNSDGTVDLSSIVRCPVSDKEEFMFSHNDDSFAFVLPLPGF